MHTCERLSEWTWKVVEEDPYGQYPFLYVVLCKDKCLLIDTGCGVGNVREFVATYINTAQLPLTVICTHSHFDHIGGNHLFADRPILMGGALPSFTNNYEINSLAAAHHGAVVRPFTVTRWLNEGDLVYFDDADPRKEWALEVINTPGHTPDSVSLYSHWERRLFVGDLLYPFTAVHVDCLGSNAGQFLASLQRLKAFVGAVGGGGGGSTAAGAPGVAEFLSVLALDPAAIDADALLQAHDGDAMSAIDFYLRDPSEAQAMFPPRPAASPSAVLLSCGHVEANLSADALDTVLGLVGSVRHAGHPPAAIDGSYAEYSDGTFTLLLPRPAKWE